MISNDALNVYFRCEQRDVEGVNTGLSRDFPLLRTSPRHPLISESNVEGLSAQEVYARLAYNRPYVSRGVTDAIPTDNGFFKHQILVGRQMFQNDSCLVMHDPGTGKTVTHVYVMLELLRARAIKHIVIVNNSNSGNKVALDTFEKYYNKLYKKHFNVSYDSFKRTYIKAITVAKIDVHNYEPYTGIVIDEAHNLFSDNEPGTKKVIRVANFVEKISELDGIKLLMLSATPIFGDISSLGKFREILYRDKNELMNQSIPSSAISYTQISYRHLDIKPMLNPAYDRSYGDRSFKLANGVEYPFLFYVSKPSPMQIADFASLIAVEDKAPFQSKQKSRIVISKLHTVTERINGIDVQVKREQSGIGAEIIKLIKKTTDGTIIIYSDLVEDGAFAMARYLESHGFESYTKQDNKGSRAEALRTNPIQQRIRSSRVVESEKLSRMENELTMMNRELRQLRKERSNTNEEDMNILIEQWSEYEKALEENKAYADIRNSLTRYTNDYIAQYQRNIEITDRLAVLENEIKEKQEEIEEVRRQEGFGTHGPTQRAQRYLLYLSAENAEQSNAFHNVFNSKENWDGSRIKVIIGSRVMRDGVDIHHAVQTHITIPDWRIPGYIQAQHRGIRSSGHEHLITGRAIRMVEEQANDPNIPYSKKITYEQARAKIIETGLRVEIYNHFLDLRLLEEDDIANARQFIDEIPTLANMSDRDVLNLLHEGGTVNNAGESIIDAAVNAYKDVGAEMMGLRANALDYKLNVQEDARVRSAMGKKDRELQSYKYKEADLLAKKDIELFFMKDNVEVIIHRITKMLLHHGYKNTDEIFEELLTDTEDSDMQSTSSTRHFTEQMIATAIVELTQNRGNLYHKYFGVELYVKLWERWNSDHTQQIESIIYLCTMRNVPDPSTYMMPKALLANAERAIHPYIAVVDTLGYSTDRHVDRPITHVRMEDVETLDKTYDTFSQLKDILERVVEGSRINPIETRFLIQLNNYWSFGWKDLMDFEVEGNTIKDPITGKLSISVYVFEGHISSPDMNCLAENLTVHEYRPSTQKWYPTKTDSLKGVFLVRYGRFIWLYRRFNFKNEPAFKPYYVNTTASEQSETNGIIFIKDYYDPSVPNLLSRTATDFVDNLTEKSFERLVDVRSKIVIKMFTVPKSRGSQIGKTFPSKDNEEFRADLIRIVEEGITLFFFLYDKDYSINDGNFSILDIKLHEMREMRLAANGTPSLRFKIFAVEQRIRDPIAKQELYKRIYKLPDGLA